MITRIVGFLFYTLMTGLCAITTVGYANDAVKALDKKN